jgi:dCMP deaminase
MSRISIHEWAMQIAEVSASRSEDPHLKVGAVALDCDNRLVGASYNGLMPHFIPPPGFWDDRDLKSKFMIHAEQNLCSLFKRSDCVMAVYVTTCPCPACFKTLISYGIQQVYYREPYDRNDDAIEIAKFYGINLHHLVKF